MSIQIQGYAGYVPEVESGTKALRVTPRPLDTAANGGTYQLAAITGIMAAGIGGASEIVQFRWLSTTHNALIRRVNVKAAALGTAFTAGTVTVNLNKYTASTIAGTGGGVAALTTLQTKLRTSMQTSQLATTGEIRIATTAALGAGTKTLNTMPHGSVITGVQNTAFIPMLTGGEGLLWSATGFEQPLTLVGTEGFSIIVTVPATGTWTAHIDILWDEVTLASY